MPAPIRAQWWNRPGWSEYLAPRIGGGKHWGYDSYCLPRTNVYAIGNGIVRHIGNAPGGFGYYIDVWYPDLGIRQREAHLNEWPDYTRVGQRVTPSTRLGRVGRTGNAKNIYWIRNGVELWHLHSQAWRGDNTLGNNLVDPRKYWGGTAGGGESVISERKSMSTIFKDSSRNLWALAGDSPGTPANWQEISDSGFVRALEAVHGKAVTVSPGVWENRRNGYTAPLNTTATIDASVIAQAVASAVADALSGLPPIQAPTVEEIAGAVDTALADDFASIPTATQNAEATRSAIIKD